ncbi:uncharacterized protein PFL1_06906 [Pseudozyma flocculosa PF-1]|uniref:Guanyl nucleotide exchange factor Sql2 n=1 Tax=Pseudozyma flocculosa PF-1 TaxID=1277687 RepID=A0A061H3V1_9BASI|nr:uncharacterized protein PFL1_06906 [Pseudozyma flocculosa PF-1]EPQ26580.1 hypothetical protein PFL1_06906 [Pseudozyma flocculosa PF-1]
MAATASRYREPGFDESYRGLASGSAVSRLAPQVQAASGHHPHMDEVDDTFFEAEQNMDHGEGASLPSSRQHPFATAMSPVDYDEEDDGAYAAPEEHVVALHDFASSNATCLSFTAGQVIKVFNRDSSGWWDGELDGERGWFPSNYVDQEGVYMGSTSVEADPHDGSVGVAGYADHAGAEGYGGGAGGSSYDARYSSRSSPTEAERYYDPMAPSRSVTPTSASWADHGNAGVLDPILHAIALLHNAVRANRVAHFQPSTACVISSVRSVLSATDCLTRESPVLKAHPPLAKERKAILSELSRLVAQARKASAPMVDETLRDHEMDAMLQMAEHVLNNVRRFLQVAVECDVAVPERRSSVYDDLYTDEPRMLTGARSRMAQERREQDKTPTPDSAGRLSAAGHHASASAQYPPRVAKSHGDLRKMMHFSRRKGSDPSSEESFEADAVANARSASHNRLVAGSRDAVRPRTDSSSDSPDSASGYEGVASRSDSADSMTEVGPVERYPQEVMRRLSLANDQLLSTIAAFIGHAHTHTAESHASSYARLIDMTREAVDGVRNLLLVVEAVNNNATLQAQRPRETAILWETRESLYEATTVLVTAARVITSAPSAAAAAASGPATDTEDKSRLLQAATGVLRTGGECVGAVRLCLDKLDPSVTIALSEPSRPSSGRTAGSAPRRSSRRAPDAPTSNHSEAGDDAADGRGDDDGDRQGTSTGIRRGTHTLSFLGRKATSLTCLKEKYERDGYVDRFDSVTEDYLDEEERESEADVADAMSAATKPVPSGDGGSAAATASSRRSRRTDSQRELRLDAATGADSTSEPMSREHSRTSGSTLQSGRSDYTADTSARPSLDFSNASEGGLASGSIQGSFSRDRDLTRQLGPISTRRASEAPARSATLVSPTRSVAGGAAGKQVQVQVQGQGQLRARAGTVSGMPNSALALEARLAKPGYEGVEVMYNSEGQVTGATLNALVGKMTPHGSTVDATVSGAFFLCFRLFTSPGELLEALVTRFDLQPSDDVKANEADLANWRDRVLVPVRLRVLNFLKSWLESHWHPPTDQAILERLIAFTQQAGTGALTKPAQRLEELARKRLATKASKANVLVGNQRGPGSLQRIISSEGLKSGSAALAMTDTSQMYAPSAFARGGPAPPASIVSKALLSNLRSDNLQKVNIMDFDPLELARQLTIVDSKLYCAIQPEELLGSKFTKETLAAAGGAGGDDTNVKSMSSMSTRITGWVSECILGEADARKRTQLVKFFIKLGDRCEALNNFHTLMAIQCALNSSTIARLKKTWDGLPQKYRTMMDHQRRSIEHTRNYAGYRARLRSTEPPAVPFLGLFLTDLTFCYEGNAPTRPCPAAPDKKLLNFDKYVKISRIINEMQRFQAPFNLVEVPEIQSYLRTALNDVTSGSGGLGADDLYRRSLLLEPRGGGTASTSGPNGANPTPASIAMRNNGGDGKTGLDIFNWRTEKA